MLRDLVQRTTRHGMTWNCFLACSLHELHVPKASKDYEPYEAVKQYWCICSSKLDHVLLCSFPLAELPSHHSIVAGFPRSIIVCPQSGIESSHDIFSLLQERKQPDFPEPFHGWICSECIPTLQLYHSTRFSAWICLCQSSRHSCRLWGSGVDQLEFDTNLTQQSEVHQISAAMF